MKKWLSLIICVMVASGCGGDSPDPIGPPASLNGLWTAPAAGLMYSVSIRIGSTSDWSGYRTSCSPVNAPACLASGAIGSATGLSGANATIDLIPTSPCGNYNARITGTASGNQITGTIVYSGCNNPNFSTASITLTR